MLMFFIAKKDQEVFKGIDKEKKNSRQSLFGSNYCSIKQNEEQ